MKFQRYDNNELLYTIELDNDVWRRVTNLVVDADQTLNELVGSHNAVFGAALKMKNMRDDEHGPYRATIVTQTKNGPITTIKKGDRPAEVLRKAIRALERSEKLLVRSNII